MKPRIAVFGNQALNIGHAIAADLSLAGYEVRFFDLPRFQEMLAPIQALGGVHVSGDSRNLVSGRTGFAKIHTISTDPEEALTGADILFVDVPAQDYEERIRAIAPYIPDGIIVHFNNYGYWPSLRALPILKAFGKERVLLSECPAPFYVARGKDGYLDVSLMRMGIPLGVFPAARSEEVFRVLKSLYPTFVAARNVLETNLENLNMLGHAGIALLNVAYFDRAKEHGETTAFFYRTGITEHTGILSEAQDRERIPVCEAYKVPYISLREFLARYYGGAGGSLTEVLLSAKFIQGIPAYSTEIWAQWIKADVPLAMVPLVLLAELAGVRTPIFRGFVDIFGALLQADFWRTGLTLERLGLAGLSVPEVIRYVTEG